MNSSTRDRKERFEKKFGYIRMFDTNISGYGLLKELEQFIADELALAVKHERERIVKALDKAKSIVEGVK